jgi:nitrate/TMAO reductase-like tetraheme cytochrome c subunit
MKCSACHAGSTGAEFVSGDRCLKCHSAEDLAPDVRVADVRFSHREHGELAPGVATSCSACHVHGSAQEDLRVDTGSCFLCHSRLPASEPGLRQADLPETGCLDCHGQPAHTAFHNTGVPVDHATVVERGITCLQCHFDVVEGTGEVPEATCVNCHASLEGAALDDEPRDAAIVHAEHARDGAEPACSRCHEPVAHEVAGMSGSLLLTCGECHDPKDAALTPPINASAHRGQQLLYIGLSEDSAAGPDPMFAEGVVCSDCHTEEAMDHPRGSVEMRAAIGEACESCHDDGYARLMDGWVDGVQARTELVGSYVRGAAQKAGVRGAGADSSARAAVRTWEFVRDANGIHNLAAADVLLRQALDAAAGAYRSAGLDAPEPPRLGPEPARESCVRCHFGVETLAASATASGFRHAVHIRDSRFDCVRCHAEEAPDGSHGFTDLQRASCTCCHSGNRYGGG